jgi:hypothetical protein
VHPAAASGGHPVQWAELGGHGGGRFEDIEAAGDLARDGDRLRVDLAAGVLENLTTPRDPDIFG